MPCTFLLFLTSSVRIFIWCPVMLSPQWIWFGGVQGGDWMEQYHSQWVGLGLVSPKRCLLLLELPQGSSPGLCCCFRGLWVSSVPCHVPGHIRHLWQCLLPFWSWLSQTWCIWLFPYPWLSKNQAPQVTYHRDFSDVTGKLDCLSECW